MRRTNRTLSTITSTITILALSGSVLSLTGCSGSDSAEEAVKDADLEFRRVSAGSAALPDSVAKQAFDASAARTDAFAGSDETFGDAAAVSLAMSKLGQASIIVDQSTDAQTELSHKIRVIHAHLSEWITLDGVARAASGINMDTNTSTMRDLIELRRTDVDAYSAQRDELQSEINELESQISALESRAAQEREKSAGFELQMRSASATESAQIAERVREHTIRADSLELESIRISGVVGQKRPAAKEIELQVLMAQNQIALLESSITELETRVRDARTDAREAQENADRARASIERLIDDVEDFNEASVMPTSDSVVRAVRDAASTARKARASSKVSGAHALSSAQQMLARTFTRQASGESQLADLYDTLTASGLPGNWSPSAESHRALADEHIESANQSFMDAASALRRGRSPGGSSESRESAIQRLETLGGAAQENEDDLGSEGMDSESFDDESFDSESTDDSQDSEG